MTWQLMWRKVRAAALNATLQLLVIYRLCVCVTNFYEKFKTYWERGHYDLKPIENFKI